MFQKKTNVFDSTTCCLLLGTSDNGFCDGHQRYKHRLLIEFVYVPACVCNKNKIVLKELKERIIRHTAFSCLNSERLHCFSKE